MKRFLYNNQIQEKNTTNFVLRPFLILKKLFKIKMK